MMTVLKCALLAGLLMSAPTIAKTDPSTATTKADRPFQGVDVRAGHPPAIAGAEGQRSLVYELHLTSFAGAPLTISAIEALDAGSGRLLARLEGPALEASLEQPGVKEGRSRTLTTGQRAVLYLEIALSSALPRALRHRIHLRRENGPAGEFSIDTDVQPIDARPIPALGPPLRDGPWVAVYDPGMARGHRRVIYAVQGRARIPGRHAIDWMAAPDRADDGAGADVLAVADAEVAAVRDRFQDPIPGAPRQDLTLGDAAGNYVALRLADGRFAVYEHLAAGVMVRPNERVRKGQVIGRLGATGQVTRPHLHFHVGDSPEPLMAEGQPYLIEEYRVLGQFESIEAFGAGGPVRTMAAQSIVRGFPPANAIVRFP